MQLRADILVERPSEHETLNVVIPWSDMQFQFTSKQNTLPASGFVQLGDERYEFTAPSFGCLDYGRGVWPEHTRWNWGAASGVSGMRPWGPELTVPGWAPMALFALDGKTASPQPGLGAISEGLRPRKSEQKPQR